MHDIMKNMIVVWVVNLCLTSGRMLIAAVLTVSWAVAPAQTVA